MTARAETRTGVAAVETALVMPFLVLVFFITVDFARIFYYTTVATFMARDGAYYGAKDPANAGDTAGIQAAANADDAISAGNPYTVTSTTGSDAQGKTYVRVTVGYNFTTVISYPGMPTSMTITRSNQMRVTQTVPD